MEQEDDNQFVVRDRRGRGTEPAPSAESSVQSPSLSPSAPASVDESHEAHRHDHGREPVTFSSFVFSLGTSALMLMGERLDPQQPTIPMNLPQAKEIIDILAMLQEKTQSNVTPDEQVVLRDMLYALRLKYVDAASGKSVAS
jgi:hypothetical protein